MFTRSSLNPILTAEMLDFPANSVFNPAATMVEDGSVVLLIRVEDRRGLSSIYVARSADGETGFSVDTTPLLAPDPDRLTCEWGFEDARVSFVPEMDRYVITCTAYGPPGPCVYLATTKDFRVLEHEAVVMTPEDKNAAVFPRRINGCWLMLHRPVVMITASADIWLSRSDDLHSWHDPQPVMVRHGQGLWDSVRIGIGPPPIELRQGWLQLYHGVRNSPAGPIYRLGAALLDLEEPWNVIRRLPEYVMAPQEPYERVGDVNNVIFPCGLVRRDDALTIYYGAADTTVCVATASVTEIVAALFDHGK